MLLFCTKSEVCTNFGMDLFKLDLSFFMIIYEGI